MAQQTKLESLQKRKSRALRVITLLEQAYPHTDIALEYTSVLELLIATMLSAQCTDERVNKVTHSLFQKYRSAGDYINVEQKELERDIFSTGFYKAKAKNIQACCTMLIEHYNGNVPGTLEKLVQLPGVGRKTANVVLSHWFDIPGLVVDTHVTRLVNRLEFCTGEDAVKLEFELMKLIASTHWKNFTHLCIAHGRLVCTARSKPKCPDCVINHECPFPTKNL